MKAFVGVCAWLALATTSLAADFQFMTASRLAQFRAILPEIEDANGKQFVSDPRTMLYTRHEIPPAYQFGHGDTTFFHSPLYNISADKPREKFGNANREFPWKVTGGTDSSPNNQGSFKGILLPVAANGQTWPIVYGRVVTGIPNSDPQAVLSWMFPRGTMVGECLYLVDSKGSWHVYEVRLRIREKDYWDIAVYRPIPTKDALIAALREIDKPAAESVIKNVSFSRDEMKDRIHPQPGFPATVALRDTLPELSEATTIKLLHRPFQLVTGGNWTKSREGDVAFAPTSKQDFSIVPKNYDATFIGNNYETCARCHGSTLTHVRHFQPGRDWYGFVRGADHIFSFHPVEPVSISRDGFDKTAYLRRDMTGARLLERFSSRRHPPDRYTKAYDPNYSKK